MLRPRSLALLACALVSGALALSPPASAEPAVFGARLAAAAAEQASRHVVYDPAYVVIPYPWGDVPADRGVCADVVVRAYRALGVDLQKRVHEDMTANFSVYPKTWGLKQPDSNIDHRRVLNLATFFTHRGAALPVSKNPADYRAGDVVTWNLLGPLGFLPHMGVVTDSAGPSGRPLIVHNIGTGPQVEDVLFDWPMLGHYRYEVAAGAEDRRADPAILPAASP
jgi:uncharacterized protein YijF (DUF1287 family)